MFLLKEEVKEAKSIGIGGHIRPDGDCTGACLALYNYLKKLLPDCDIKVYLEKPAETFRILKGYDEICSQADGEKTCDVFFAVDSVKERLGEAEKLFDAAKKRINIDHHISNPGCGDVNYIDSQASSACELVYGLLDSEEMDGDIAKALYVGLIHDTGIFQYSNTSPKTLRIAAELISYGFDFSRIIDETFYEKTYVQNQIMGRALLESIVFLDGKCIVSGIDRKLMNFYHAAPVDLDGIVNQLRLTKGVECAIFMYETNTLEYKVSLRSSDKVNVAEIARFFGGGGHKKAAGCTMSGTFHDVVNNLSVHIESQLKEYDG